MRKYVMANHIFIICFIVLALDSFLNYLIFYCGSLSNASYGYAYIWLLKTIVFGVFMAGLLIFESVRFLKNGRTKSQYMLGLLFVIVSYLFIIYGIPIPKLIK